MIIIKKPWCNQCEKKETVKRHLINKTCVECTASAVDPGDNNVDKGVNTGINSKMLQILNLMGL